MQNNTHHVPSQHSSQTTSSTNLDPAVSALEHLQTAIQTANATKTSLITQLHTLRQTLHSSFDTLATSQATQTTAVQRAARSLAVRAMELDNRALQLDHSESTFQSTRTHFDTQHANRQRTLEEDSRRLAGRETSLLAREASLKYSAVEQMRLHAWSRELEKREARVGDAEHAEKERIAARVTAVARRELLVAERERRLDAVIKEREIDVARREKAVDAVAHALENQRSEALLQIEAERSQFWAHQQKLSAVVAAETDALLTEQATLRKQFEAHARDARRNITNMTEQVTDMNQLVAHVRAARANGFCDVDVDKSALVAKLAGISVTAGESAEQPAAAEDGPIDDPPG